MTKYQDDPDFKLLVKKLVALAFLPLADVIDAFEVLADTFEDDELPEGSSSPASPNRQHLGPHSAG